MKQEQYEKMKGKADEVEAAKNSIKHLEQGISQIKSGLKPFIMVEIGQRSFMPYTLTSGVVKRDLKQQLREAIKTHSNAQKEFDEL